jgi:hypothetical protein
MRVRIYKVLTQLALTPVDEPTFEPSHAASAKPPATASVAVNAG